MKGTAGFIILLILPFHVSYLRLIKTTFFINLIANCIFFIISR